MENPETQDMDSVSEDAFQDVNLVQRLLCETECLKQVIEDMDNDPREATHELEQRRNIVEGWYSLEQYIGFEGRQAFIHYCGLHQV